MPDKYGVPLPGNAEDYQQFMLGLYDLLAAARDLQAQAEAIEMLAKARRMFIEDFEAKHPGYGEGRAVWR
ncbi:hypothetical protein EAH89_28275 [Roseomonas nepalensis]|uniref:Uncharacterized protein n=1 Tax=Muricoccus nepalensis TaxID=1854500 RepID=A0A502EY36_9PROT|nr:hypothetical protein [Roseomonas nepalensis]TPG41944.1 hypothetical protein EAH89_28275 [Roseomonas nepalensis]